MKSLLLSCAVLLLALVEFSSSARADTVLFSDDFTRAADSVNDPTLGTGSPGTWVLNQPDTISTAANADVQILTGTVSIEGTQTGLSSQRLFFNSAGPVSGPTLYPNNNDASIVYHTFDLDTKQQYTESFKYALHHLSTYSSLATQDAGAPSQVSGGDFIIPRAEGTDLPGNVGWQIRRLGTAGGSDLPPNAPLSILAYSGAARSTFIAPGTALPLPFVMQVDTEYRFTVAVNGDTATLYVNGKAVDTNRDLTAGGALLAKYNNSTPDHVMFGYNAMATGQRRTQFSIDDLLVVAPQVPAPGVSVTWNNTPGGTWDTSSTNWTSSRGDLKYHENDDAIFSNATGANLVVNLNGAVNPNSVAVTTNGSYTLQGTGFIASGSLTKSSSGTLTILTNNVNDFGTTTINAGTIQVGNGGTTGQLGGGDITNNGTLIFNRSNGMVVTNAIGGTGAVQINGVGGTVTLAATNSFSSGLTVNAGTALLLSPTVVGTGSAGGSGTITANTGATVGFYAAAAANSTYANPVVANGAKISSQGLVDVTLSGGVAVSGNVTALTVDAKNLGGPSHSIILTAPLTGTGNINVVNSTAVGVGTASNLNADAQQALRLRSSDPSNYSGTITVNQAAKLELQTTDTGPLFSPAGTGKIVLTGGTITGSNALYGNYSELTLRDNTAGNVTLGNNVEVAGTGTVIINPQSDSNIAPAGSVITMGNLKIGAGQELATYKNTTTGFPLTVAFPSVTLTGDGAKFAPKKLSFGAVASDGGDISLGPISMAAGVTQAGITIAGAGNPNVPRAVILTGNNTYSGVTNVASGILRLGAADRIPNSSNMILGNNSATQTATFDTGGFDEQLGTLQVSGATASGVTTIDLSSNTRVSSNVHFGASANVIWNGLNQLMINNYQPGVDHIFFGSTNTGTNRGLSVSQLRMITINFGEVSLAANGELVPGSYPAALTKGDVNGDNLVNAADINALLVALADPTKYASTHNRFASDVAFAGDYNGDGFFNNSDIQPLLDFIASQPGGGSVAAVPEPSSLALLALGACGLFAFGVKRRKAA